MANTTEKDERPPAGPAECRLVLMPSGRRGQITHGTDLLTAARSLGVELEAICGGRQTCGKCQIIIEEGRFPKHGLTSAADHVSVADGREAAYRQQHNLDGRRLACATRVLDDVLITVPEESQARKQIIAKAATERVIDIQPAARQVYVEIEPAELEDRRGDWERLQDALAEQWNLTSLSIDPVLLPHLQTALRRGNWTATVTLWQDREVLRVEPGYAEGLFGLAVDIGSTTVAAHLCDLRTGAVLATEAMMNPQVRYGEDLMSRVSYGMMEPQGVARMHRAIIRALNELAAKATSRAGLTVEDVVEAVLVGNTVMHHLLLGIDPVELGGAPFALAVDGPLDLKARQLGLKFHPGARVHILPCIAGHVGADNVAVLLAEAPHRQPETMLVVDVGTNAEILLGNREQVLSASSPTGPAFEGAQIRHGQRAASGAIERVRIDRQTLESRFKVLGHDDWIGPEDVPPEDTRATGICGSGIIEAVAELFLAGAITADGLFNRAAAERSSRLRFNGRAGEYILAGPGQTASGQPIVVTQNDVRAIQLAKGALYAGIKLLMNQQGVKKVDRVVLAGAFGSYISPLHAMVLGLIPDCELERVTAVGNAAGDGARIALLNREQRAEIAQIARWVDYVETAVDPDFQTEFVAAMALPHASDPFPHLAAILPTQTINRPPRRSRRRRSTQSE
ncbi:MAG: ASKHA domain-containing protein [Anaerolineae bacterium]